MTEYELADLLTSTTVAAVETFAVYISLMVAYLVATYLAGQKLSKPQIVTVSALYIVATSILIWAYYFYMSRAIRLADMLEELNPEAHYGAQPIARDILAVMMILGMLACLKFMWDSRHPKGQ